MLEFHELMVETVYHKQPYERIEMRLSVDSVNRYYIRFGKAFYDTLSEKWFPTRDGATIPLTVDTGQGLLIALSKILAFAETQGIIEKVMNDEVNPSV